MTEKEYCETTDLARIRTAKAVLADVVPQCGHDAIAVEDWHKVMSQLIEWDNILAGAIKISDS